MTKNNYTTRVTISPFKYDVLVILANNFNAALAELGIGREYREKAALFAVNKEHRALVFNASILDHGLIAHESAHCVFSAMAEAGQDPVSAEETFAYMLEDLVDSIHTFCKAKKVKID
ncbi:MAG: hypothetical protein WCG52_11360 [bacterium]